MIANAHSKSVVELLDEISSRHVAIAVAHPDDETIGAGSLLPRLRDVQLIFTTDGAPQSMHDAIAAGCATREEYAARRRREAEVALATAGIPSSRMTFLSFADQEASLHLVELTRALFERFARAVPDLVLTHPYEGGHPDHDATAFAVHAASLLLQQRSGISPIVLEMTSYHNGPQGICTGEFLPNPLAEEIETIELTTVQQQQKRELLAHYTTQKRMLEWFGVAAERFRVAPRYDFTQSPHAGPLFYEQFDWGMSGERWRQLAEPALKELGLSDAL
jgi:LmbE family N-acetylglucosaminyl deacetylase